jgi:hypothetical protein
MVNGEWNGGARRYISMTIQATTEGMNAPRHRIQEHQEHTRVATTRTIATTPFLSLSIDAERSALATQRFITTATFTIIVPAEILIDTATRLPAKDISRGPVLELQGY